MTGLPALTRRLLLLLLVSLLPCFTVVSAEKRGYDFGVWQSVPTDYHWNHRPHGITHFWNPSLCQWKHYTSNELLNNEGDEDNNNQDSQPVLLLEPEPWTQGRVVKNAIMLNVSAFEVWSLYEPSAIGHWPVSKKETTPVDSHSLQSSALHESHHIYIQTPFRLTQLPGVYMPASVQLPDGHDSSRATVVQPDAASYSGPRWLPTQQEAEILQYMHDQSTQNDNSDSNPFYRRWSFSELWLTDPVHGCKDGRKVGLFVQYHGLTGELLQLICMRERSLMPTTSPEALVYYSPDTAVCDMDHMQRELEQLDNSNERHVLKTPAARALINGDSIEKVLGLGNWDVFNARIVQSRGLLGPEIACVVQNRPASELVYASPFLENPSAYYDIRWKDGVYARIPKRLSPHMDDVCLELGGLTAAGDFHRLMAVGSRASGSLHTTVYEKWSHGSGVWGVARHEDNDNDAAATMTTSSSSRDRFRGRSRRGDNEYR